MSTKVELFFENGTRCLHFFSIFFAIVILTMFRGSKFAHCEAMKRARYHLALAVANILFGANFSIYVSLMHSGIDFRQIFMLQIVAAALFFIPRMLTVRHARLSVEDFGTIFIVALLVIYGWLYMLLWGASSTNAIDASMISTLGPVFTLLAARIFHSERLSWLRIIGIVTALAGAAVLLVDEGRNLVGNPLEAYGNALVLCAVVAIAVNTLLIRSQLRQYGVTVVMGWYYTIGFLMTVPFFWPQLAALDAHLLTPTVVAELLYVMILGTVLPMYLLYVGTEHLTATHTALYRYLQFVVATLLTLLRGQSSIDRANVVGAALIFVGIVAVALGAHRKMHNYGTGS